MGCTISVIIPARNASSHIGACLQSLRRSVSTPLEVLVVDDSSTDETRSIAESLGVRILNTERRMGPSFARNLAASVAVGDILFFLDADVCVRLDTLSRIAQSFDADAGLDAVIGSYDTQPGSPDFISQYRNLMHAFVHQTGSERASTFWSGCGAIRRPVFLKHSGFSVAYKAIEDIELGYRLTRAEHKIILDREILVTHLKKWTFWGLVKTDIMDRGIPWTELILRDGCMPNDLNLQVSQRISVALVFVLVALSGYLAIISGAYLITPLISIVIMMLARWWGEFGVYERPRRYFLILTVMIGFTITVAFGYRMYGLIPPLLLVPLLLWLRHRYSRAGKLKRMHRHFGLTFIGSSVCVAALYLPAHRLVFAFFAVVVLLALMNSQFYIFLIGNRGVAFMLAAIPFHLLYHFYNGLAFIAGLALHSSRSRHLSWLAHHVSPKDSQS